MGIIVNEEGSEAAAATGAILEVRGRSHCSLGRLTTQVVLMIKTLLRTPTISQFIKFLIFLLTLERVNLTMMILRKLIIIVLAESSKLVLKKFVYLVTPELNVSALKI